MPVRRRRRKWSSMRTYLCSWRTDLRLPITARVTQLKALVDRGKVGQHVPRSGHGDARAGGESLAAWCGLRRGDQLTLVMRVRAVGEVAAQVHIHTRRARCHARRT